MEIKRAKVFSLLGFTYLCVSLCLSVNPHRPGAFFRVGSGLDEVSYFLELSSTWLLNPRWSSGEAADVESRPPDDSVIRMFGEGDEHIDLQLPSKRLNTEEASSSVTIPTIGSYTPLPPPCPSLPCPFPSSLSASPLPASLSPELSPWFTPFSPPSFPPMPPPLPLPSSPPPLSPVPNPSAPVPSPVLITWAASSHSIHTGVGIGRSRVQHLLYASLSNPLTTPRRRGGGWSSNQLFCTASLIVNRNNSQGKKRNPAKPVDKSKINSNVSPHRAASAVRLLRIEQGGAFADLLNADYRESAIDDEMDYIQRTLGFRTNPLDARNTRLVTDIVAGVVRWKRYLDYLIFSLYDGAKNVKDMEPLLQQILRIGVYEIVKLGMPPYAVVNENVTLARAALRAGAGNMVNGILRRVASDREKDMLPLPKVEGDDRSKARALSVKYSHPVWMIRRWMTYLGQEGAIQLMEWNNSPPSFSLRANSGRGVSRDDLVLLLKKLNVQHELSPHMTEFVRLSTGLQSVIQAGLLKEGMCAVQDEGAGLVVSVVDPQPGETIIDCCAAPGGKALFMASRLEGQGSVIAIDVNQGRLRVLEEAAKVQALEGVVNACQDDIRSFAVGASIRADKVLLDAPCSGLGVLCKKPDMRWKRTLKDLEQLILLQDELLDAASLLVKPGGILVYSTCSVDPGENKERVESFLTRHPEFIVEAVHKYVPNEFISEEGFYTSHPTKHFLDGAFAARLFRVSI